MTPELIKGGEVIFISVLAMVTCLAAIKAVRDVASRYVASSTELRRTRFRAEDWASFEPINITETVATVVAAAVAVRFLHQFRGNNASSMQSPILTNSASDDSVDFRKIRRIVRRMTSSIRSGEARALRAKRIIWLHREDTEDEFEQQVLISLGADVQFFWENDEMLNEVDDSMLGKVAPIDLIITNKRHFLSRAREQLDSTAGEQFLMELRKRHVSTPIIVYSRSLDGKDEQRFKELGAETCVSYPEDFIHAVMTAARPNATRDDSAQVRKGGVNSSNDQVQIDPVPT